MSEFMGIRYEVDDRLSGNQWAIYNHEKIVFMDSDGSIHEFTWEELAKAETENPGSEPK